jgi:hypothetical protein
LAFCFTIVPVGIFPLPHRQTRRSFLQHKLWNTQRSSCTIVSHHASQSWNQWVCWVRILMVSWRDSHMSSLIDHTSTGHFAYTWFHYSIPIGLSDHENVQSNWSGDKVKVKVTKELCISSWISFHVVEHWTPNMVGSNIGNKKQPK